MSYGEKYRLEYRDKLIEGEDGRLTTIKILKRDFVGDFEYVKGSANPLMISGKTDNDDLFSQIVVTSAEIELISEVSFQFLDMFSADFREHKIEVWKEPIRGEAQILFWTGWVLPDNYIEPLHFYENYIVKITATDGLGRLKEEALLNSNGLNYSGKVTLSEAIREMCFKTGLELPFKYCLSFTEIYTNQALNVFDQIYIDWETFYFKNTSKCDYVLKQILQAFGARIKQSKAHWIIEEVTAGAIERVRFLSDFSTEVHNPVRAFTGKDNRTANRLFFENKEGDLQINPAYKSFEIYHDFLKRESLIKNGSFENWTFNSEIPATTPFGDYTIKYWTKNPFNSQFPKTTEGDNSKYYLDLYGYYGAFNTAEYIQSDAIDLNINERTAKFILEFRRYKYETYIEIKIGSKWINADGDFVTSVYRHLLNTSSPTDFTKFELDINQNGENTATGNLIVRIYRPFTGGLPTRGTRPYFHINNVVFAYTDVSSNYKDISFDVVVNENNNFVPDKIESILGDIPNVLDREYIYAGTFWRYDSVNAKFIPSLLWSSTGQAQNTTILQCLAELITDNSYKPKQFLTGLGIRGNFDFDSCIEINFLDNRRYIPIHWDLNDKYCKWSIDCIEVLQDRIMAKETDNDFIVTEDNDFILL